MCTIHANSAREAVAKMCTLPLLAGHNVTNDFVVPTVATCIDLVVHIVTHVDGSRRVREIVAVPGRTEDGIVEIEDIFTWRQNHPGSGQLRRADGYPPHPERFALAGYDVRSLLADVAEE